MKQGSAENWTLQCNYFTVKSCFFHQHLGTQACPNVIEEQEVYKRREKEECHRQNYAISLINIYTAQLQTQLLHLLLPYGK